MDPISSGGPRTGDSVFGLPQIFNNYWTRSSKISWFVSSEYINYPNNWSARHWLIAIFAITKLNNCFIFRSPSLFSYFNHFLASHLIRVAICHFSLENVVSITHEQNICSKTCFDETTREQTIIRLFVGSYLQVTWWALGQWKGRTYDIE